MAKKKTKKSAQDILADIKTKHGVNAATTNPTDESNNYERTRELNSIKKKHGVGSASASTNTNALASNNPAYAALQKYGDGKTGTAANKAVKGTANKQSTERKAGQINALGAGTYNKTKLDSTLNSAVYNTAGSLANLWGLLREKDTQTKARDEADSARLKAGYDAMLEGKDISTSAGGLKKLSEDSQKDFEKRYAATAGTGQSAFNAADSLMQRSAEEQAQAKEGLGKFGQGLVDLGVAGAQFVGDIAANAILPGAGLAAMGARAAGGGAYEARQEGLDLDKQLTAGAKSAAIELLTEKLFGAGSKIAYGKGIVKNQNLVNSLVNRMAKTDKGRTALKVLTAANEEGLEEVLSDVLNPIADRILKLDDGKGDWSDLGTDMDMAQMLEDYLIGATLGAFGAGANVVSGQYKAENAQQRAYEEYQKALVNEGLAAAKGSNAQVTAEEYKNILDQSSKRGNRNLSDAETENMLSLLKVEQDSPAVSARLTALGQDADTQTVSAIIKTANGEKLTKGEQQAFAANPYAQRVVNEMTDTEGATSNAWYADNSRSAAYTPQNTGISAVSAQQALDTAIKQKAATLNQKAAAGAATFNAAAKAEGVNTVTQALAQQHEVPTETIQAVYNLKADTDPQSFSAAFNVAYTMGEQGANKAALTNIQALTPAQANIAYTMGSDKVKAATAANTQEVTENEIRLRESGQRLDSQNTGGQISGLAESTERDTSGQAQSQSRNGKGAAGNDGQVITGKARKVTGKWSNDMRTAAKSAKERGYKTVFFESGNIKVKGGEARGMVDPETKKVYIRTDHPDYTATQIMKHELTHADIAEGKVSLDKIREDLHERFTDTELDAIAQAYADAYEGAGMTVEEAFEEICCDAVGEMNIFAGTGQTVERYEELLVNAKKSAERQTNQGRAPPRDKGVKYSRDKYDYSKPFDEQVDDWIDGKIPKNDSLVIGATPDVFKQVGFNALPMTINQSHVDYAINGTKKSNHHIGAALLKQLPAALKDPVAIITSKTKNNTSLVALLPFTHNGETVVAPVYVDGYGKQNNIVIDSNAVTSIYGRSNAVTTLLTDAINEHNSGKTSLFYINTAKAAALYRKARVVMPKNPRSRNGFVASIRDESSPVKPKFANVTETQQFRRWFGNSKVVNEDGTPKVVYHQTENDFTVFDTHREGAGARDNGTPFGIFLKSSDRDIGLKGKKQMALYAKIVNPLRAQNRSEFSRLMRNMSQEYDALITQHEALDREYKSKTQQAMKNLKDFMIDWRTNNPGADSRSLYDVPEFERLFDAEDTLATEWTAKADELTTKAKKAMTEALEGNGYDGVILENDEGSLGRSTDAYIALRPEQIKSATDNIGTFDANNPDIRYSLESQKLSELRRENENKLAQATAEDAKNENERGLIKAYQNQYGKVKDIEEKLSAAQQELVTAENEQETTKAQNRVTLLKRQYSREHQKLNGYAETKALQNVLDRVNERTAAWVTDAQAEGSNRLHDISAEQRANVERQQNREAQEVPKKDPKGKLTSKHVSTIINSGITPAEFSAKMLEDAEQGKFSHIAYSDEEALAKASRKIEKAGWEDALAEYKANVNSGKTSKDITVMGIALYNNAVNSEDYATAMDIASLMVKNSKTTAQALQAMRILNKLSPECKLYLAARSVENIQDELNERYKKNKADIHVDEVLYNEYARALRSGEEAKIKDAWAKIEQNVAQQIDATWYEKLNQFRYLAMLGNPRTHIRNIVGNAFFAPVRSIKNTIAYGLETAADKFTESGIEKSKAMLNPTNKEDAALINYANLDYDSVQEVIMSGGKYVDTFQGVDKHRTIYKKVKPLEKLSKFNSEALDKEDAWFCKPAYSHALARWYKANGITAEQLLKGEVAEETIIKAQETAIKEAQKATYRDLNWFSEHVNMLNRVKNKPAKVLVEGLMPFKKTPANILSRALEYSPAGLIKTLAVDTKKLKTYVKGDIENGMSPAQYIDNMASGLTGTALVGLGVLLASMGVLNGGDDDDEKQNNFDELKGGQNYALNVGGLSITLDWLAPESMPLFVGVEMFNAFSAENENNDALTSFIASLIDMAEPMLEMSMLQSVNDLFDNLQTVKEGQGGYRVVASMATSYITQYFPTLFGQAERAFTETERETTYIDRNDNSSKELRYLLAKIANKIPGYDYSQIPYIDAWGRRESTGNLLERTFNNFLNPAYVKEERNTPIDSELERLYELGNTGVYPSRAATNTKINGKYLTADEYVTYATEKGQISYDMAEQIINSSEYRSATDGEKAYMLETAYRYANNIAKYKVNSSFETNGKWIMSAYNSGNPARGIIDHAMEWYSPSEDEEEK